MIFFKLNFKYFLRSIVFAAFLILFGQVNAAEIRQRYAAVLKVSGAVVATSDGLGQSRTLQVGDIVYVNERVQSDGVSEAVLRTDDGGVIAVRPAAAFAMEQFKVGAGGDEKFNLRIFSGGLRLITGLIGIRSRENYKVTTPTATMGIRGTDYEPYVLSPELAINFRQPEGTYNKVNKGSTFLDMAGEILDVNPGQVGFAKKNKPAKDRGLITVLVPVLLEKVPDFYIPGRFDVELEYIASSELLQAQKTLGILQSSKTSPSFDSVNPTVLDRKTSSSSNQNLLQTTPDTLGCRHNAIAFTWLNSMDQALISRDPQRFLDLFAPEALVLATVRQGNGASVTVNVTREELVQSTLTSLRQMSEFRTSRPSTRSAIAGGNDTKPCSLIEVESVVIEQGIRNGAPFRMESLERYELVLRNGNWLAVKAQTTQR